MNCEKCHQLLSDFLDGSLSGDERSSLAAHLDECITCHSAHYDLSQIITFCREHRGEEVSPPNPRALWLRIRNTIESENLLAAAGASASASASARAPWWTRFLNRTWELSLPQLAMAVSAIVIAVSLATAYSLNQVRKSAAPVPAAEVARETAPPASGSSAMVDLPAANSSNPRGLDIEYWDQRVAARMNHWSPERREAFQRNINVIDQAIKDAQNELRRNPHDEVSEEMLNAALSDKMQILKEFSDL